MAEGGQFPWRRQKIDESRGPAAYFGNLHKSLPDPPSHMQWVRDEKTKDWRLEEKEIVVVEAFPVSTSKSSDSNITGSVNADSATEPTYVEHLVSGADTFQGICIRYKITPTELRQANGGFSGTNLLLAPNPLRIPRNKEGGKVVVATRVDDTEIQSTPQYMIEKLLKTCPDLSRSEARCYLELNDWNLKEALCNASDDGF